MDTPEQNDLLNQLENYRKIVLQYEGLNDQIQSLLNNNNGGTKDMSPEDVAHYRDLAHQRDEALNEMRRLEQELLDEDIR